MAQHKAPTAVTVAPLTEQTAFEKWVSRYWVHASLVILVIAGWVTYRHYQAQKVVAQMDTSWSRVTAQTTLDQRSGLPTATPEVLAGLATELKGTAAGPSARVLEIHAKIDARDYAGAKSAIESLKAEYPTHPWVSSKYSFRDGASEQTLPEQLALVVDEKQTWESAHPDLWANPAVAADAPKVRFTTDAGTFTLGLYSKEAPKHVDNFLKLCTNGFYKGTRFHTIESNTRIVGGDPNSIEGDPATWGLGGPGYNLDPGEKENGLRNFAGAVGMEMVPGEAKSSGSQFYIASEPVHYLDGQRVVFGTVIDGLDVIRKIASAPVAKETPNRPETPVVIQNIEVL